MDSKPNQFIKLPRVQCALNFRFFVLRLYFATFTVFSSERKPNVLVIKKKKSAAHSP